MIAMTSITSIKLKPLFLVGMVGFGLMSSYGQTVRVLPAAISCPGFGTRAGQREIAIA